MLAKYDKNPTISSILNVDGERNKTQVNKKVDNPPQEVCTTSEASGNNGATCKAKTARKRRKKKAAVQSGDATAENEFFTALNKCNSESIQMWLDTDTTELEQCASVGGTAGYHEKSVTGVREDVECFGGKLPHVESGAEIYFSDNDEEQDIASTIGSFFTDRGYDLRKKKLAKKHSPDSLVDGLQLQETSMSNASVLDNCSRKDTYDKSNVVVSPTEENINKNCEHEVGERKRDEISSAEYINKTDPASFHSNNLLSGIFTANDSDRKLSPSLLPIPAGFTVCNNNPGGQDASDHKEDGSADLNNEDCAGRRISVGLPLQPVCQNCMESEVHSSTQEKLDLSASCLHCGGWSDRKRAESWFADTEPSRKESCEDKMAEPMPQRKNQEKSGSGVIKTGSCEKFSGKRRSRLAAKLLNMAEDADGKTWTMPVFPQTETSAEKKGLICQHSTLTPAAKYATTSEMSKDDSSNQECENNLDGMENAKTNTYVLDFKILENVNSGIQGLQRVQTLVCTPREINEGNEITASESFCPVHTSSLSSKLKQWSPKKNVLFPTEDEFGSCRCIRPPDVLRLDKSCSTSEVSQENIVDVEVLQSCFPDVSLDIINEFIEKCGSDIDWAVNILLDTGCHLSTEILDQHSKSENMVENPPASDSEKSKGAIPKTVSALKLITEAYDTDGSETKDELGCQAQRVEGVIPCRMYSTNGDISKHEELPSVTDVKLSQPLKSPSSLGFLCEKVIFSDEGTDFLQKSVASAEENDTKELYRWAEEAEAYQALECYSQEVFDLDSNLNGLPLSDQTDDESHENLVTDHVDNQNSNNSNVAERLYPSLGLEMGRMATDAQKGSEADVDGEADGDADGDASEFVLTLDAETATNLQQLFGAVGEFFPTGRICKNYMLEKSLLKCSLS